MTKAEKIEQTAQEMRRAYHREWQRKNKEKTREYHKKYWQKKAAAALDQTTEEA